MRENGVQNLVFTSTPAIFGYHEEPLTENLSTNPESLYGASKLSSELFIRTFSNLYGIRAWIIRLSNIVGERATHGVIFDLINKINKAYS